MITKTKEYAAILYEEFEMPCGSLVWVERTMPDDELVIIKFSDSDRRIQNAGMIIMNDNQETTDTLRKVLEFIDQWRESKVNE